ncbi:MAG: hypothetical protein HYU67_09835, partial [Flavobacteriia bacterium]|nr:hypothetical protein [Flavobacteriia bacterium]
MRLSIRFFVLSIFCSTYFFSQAPANDDCAGAFPLIVGASCTYTSFTNVNATSSTGTANPTCSSYSGGDVWFSIVVPASGALLIQTEENGGMTDSGITLYSGSCGGVLSEEACDDDLGNGYMSKITVSGLIPASTVFLRVFGYNGEEGTFDLCVTTPPPTPTNDECANAINVLISPNNSCTSEVSGTVESATTSLEANTCTGTSDDDVWYSFTASSTELKVGINDVVGSTTDMMVAVYSGTCASLTELSCQEYFGDGTSVVSGLSFGQSYKIRIYTWSATSGEDTDFDVCVSVVPTPPVNDNCANATNLNVNADLSCTSITSGTIESATASIETNTCTGSADDDIWYSFVANAAQNSVGIDNVVGTTTDMIVAVYSGSCASLTLLSCEEYFGTGSSSISGLTNGQTYLVRIYSNTATTGQITSFDVCVGTPPPPPANDDCLNSIPLTVNTSCTYSDYTNLFATSSAGIPAPGCANYQGSDVWFSFVVPANGDVIVNMNDNGGMSDAGMAWYTGTCASLTLSECDDDDSENGNMSKISQTGLTPGETIFVRIWGYGTGNDGTFQICASEPATPPANDDCAFPVVLPVNSDMSCTSNVQGTIESATASLESNTCSGTSDDDVWYSFVANGTQHSVGIENAVGSTTDMMVAVYSGTCASLTQLSCNEFFGSGTNSVGGLTIGQTYLVRIYSWTATGGQSTTFDVCVGTPPPPPANDECAGALSVSINADLSCTSITSGTLESATASAQTNSCNGTSDDDVWYSFIANGPQHSVGIENAVGSTTDMMVAVYSGTCGTLTQLSCDEYFGAGSASVGGLTIGQTYLVRIYSWSATGGQNTTFDVCVGTPPPPPANDECANAIVLPVNTSCVNTSATNEYATNSVTEIPASCASFSGGDVWFSFVVPASGNTVVTTSTGTGTLTDSGMAWYTGTCGSLTELVCSDDGEASLMSRISQSGLTPGQTIYARVYGYSGASGSFDVCATEPPIPPSNDECSNAISLTVNPTSSCTNILSSSIESATASIQTNDCNGTADDDIWFSFVASNTSHLISLSNILGSAPNMNYSVYNGTCATPGTAVLCSDDDFNTVSGLTIGNTYLVRVYTFSSVAGQNTSFDICVATPTPPSNDDCLNAIAVTPSNNTTCTPIASTISFATTSGQTNTCSGTADDDVWYSFVANSTDLDIDLLNIDGSTTDLYHSVYDGSCASLGTTVVCSDPNSSSLTGLTIGNTYLLRIYSWTATTGQIVDFDLCITNPNVTSSISLGTITNPTTCGGSDGSVVINGTNTLIGNLSWTGVASGSVSNVVLPYTVTGLIEGAYDFTFNDGNVLGPISTTLSDPLPPATPTITANGLTTFCTGGSVDLTSSSLNNNVWSTLENTQTITVSTSGSYTVSVTENGCTSTSSPLNVTVHLSSVISVSSSSSPTSCGASDGSITLNSASTGLLNWTGPVSGFQPLVVFPYTITGLSAGSYSIELNDLNGCISNILNESISDPGAPSNPTITASGSTTFCDGGSVVLTSSPASQYLWSNGETTQSITVNISGNFNVTITELGCSSTSLNENVTVNPNPVITLGTVANPSSCGSSTGSVEILGSGLGEILWSGTSNGGMNNITLPINILNFAAGSYSFQFTDVNLCQSNIINQTLTDPGAPAIPIITTNGPTTFCDGGSVVLTSSLASQYLWSTGETTQSITVSTTGNYNVTITELGCSSSSSNEIVTVNSNPVISLGSVSNPTSCGSSTGSIQILGSGFGNLIWSGTNNGSMNNINLPQTVSNLSVGAYSVQFTDANFCQSNVLNQNLTDPGAPASPTINTNGSTTFCDGGSVVLTSSLASQYLWSTGETTQSITVSTSGNYNVTITEMGCSSTSSNEIVTVNSNPVIALGSVVNPTSCGSFTGSIQILGNGFGNIIWYGTSSGNVNSISLPQTISNLSVGSYSFLFMDGNFCQSNVVAQILTDPGAPATPTITPSGNVDLCDGNSITLTSSALTGNTWSTGETTQSITVSSADNYTVTVTVSSCTSSPSLPVVVNVLPNITPSITIISDDLDNQICLGTTVQFNSFVNNGGTNPTYSWFVNGVNTGVTTDNFITSTLNNNDVISCSIISNENCAISIPVVSNDLNMSVQSVLVPAISISSNDFDNIICVGSSLTFTASPINGGSNPQYTWMLNGNSVGSTGSTYTNSSLNNGDIVSCQMLSNDNCLSTINAISNEITISVVATLTPTISITSNVNDNTICTGSSMTFTAVVNNGGSNPSYQWKVNGINVGINSNSYSSSSLNNGDIVTCVLFSNDPCASPTIATSNSFTVIVTGLLIPSVSILSNDPDNSVCPGVNVEFTANASNVGANELYSWYINGILQVGSSNTFITNSLNQSDIINCEVTSMETCANPSTALSNSITININSNPVITLGGVSNTTDCGANDGFFEITGSGTGIIYWSGTSSGSTTTFLPAFINNLTAGNYSAYLDLDGCISNIVSATINDPALPTAPIISATGNTTFCEGNSVILSSSQSSGNVWSTTETTQTINVSTAGTYFVTVYSAPNCSAVSNSIDVLVNPIPSTPTVTAIGSTTFCEGGSVELSSSSASGNTWNTTETTNTITVSTSGTYSVTVTENGCTSLSSNQVTVTANPIPNTP